jgi:hypothetical protein
MTRPEGNLLVGLILLDLLPRLLRKEHEPFLVLLVVYLALYGVYIAIKTGYYGDIVPNTFHAKVGLASTQFLRGVKYVARFVIASFFFLLPVAWLVLRRRWKVFAGQPFVFPLIGLYTVYIISVGGDPMPAFRFFTPLLPLVAILSAVGLMDALEAVEGAEEGPLRRVRDRVKPHERGKVVMAVVLLVCAYSVVQTATSRSIGAHIKNEHVALVGKEVGLWLRDVASPDAVVATNTAGSIPYWSGLRTIDMLGLNDRHIALRESLDLGAGAAGHEKGDGGYVLDQEPEFIQFGSSAGTVEPVFLGDYEIWEDPRFHATYRLEEVPLSFGTLRIYVHSNVTLPA